MQEGLRRGNGTRSLIIMGKYLLEVEDSALMSL